MALLVAGLRSPDCYAHPARDIAVHETHISYVVLAGDYAYKLKKPVDLGFLDFRGLEARRHFCAEEVRLNRRTAPGIYLGTVPITGSEACPRVDGPGPAIEYAVRMRRFPQEALLSERARAGSLDPGDVVALAAGIARFHAGAERIAAGRDYGSPAHNLEAALSNLRELLALEPAPALLPAIGDLREWTLAEHARAAGAMASRQAAGFVRECHGDLHLANVVRFEGRPVAFDAIEFSAKLRWIDVMNDIAFTVMDLERYGLRDEANRFLNGYLEASGDYGGLAVLRFYVVYRALVRAKIAAIRARQEGLDPHEKMAARQTIRDHVLLAQRLSVPDIPRLVVMHGLSGSGKTTLSGPLAASLGAIRVRSDLERKRLHGLEPLARTGSAPGGGLYGSAQAESTYERLATLAATVIDAGYPVVVDAAFLKSWQREKFRALAERRRVGFAIASCAAPVEALRRRIAARGASDASEAGLAVLEWQVSSQDPLDETELAAAIFLA